MADKNITLEEQIVVSAKDAVKSLEDIITAVEGVKGSVKDAKNESIGLASAFKSSLSSVGKSVGALFSLRKITKYISQCNQEAMDLIETTNLFEVSFGKGMGELNKYYEKAIKFQNDLSEALGTNLNESMNFQALFNSMGTSMGLDRETAYTISENFTKLGYDLASLYNTETSKAMEKLQSGLSGASTRPLRAFGIDITQSTLSNTLADLGIDKTIGQLNQAEKMVLRYISVIRQASVAHGDFAKTLESPANQLRIFQAQLLSLKQNLGSLWQGVLQRWMPYINAMLMVINALIKAIAGFFGIKVSSSVQKMSVSLDDGASGASGISSGLGSANKSAKELKETLDLMPWDEIHNIDLAKDTSSSSGGGGGGVSGGGGGASIDQGLLDAMKAMAEYDNLMGEIENKATALRDKWMDILGFEKIVDETTGEISWKLREGYQKIELIRDILAGLVIGTLATKLAKLFFTPQQLENIAKATTGLDKLRMLAGAITLSIGAVTILGGISERDMKQKLIGILEVGAGTGLLFKSWKAGVIGIEIAGAITLVISSIDWVVENYDHSKDVLDKIEVPDIIKLNGGFGENIQQAFLQGVTQAQYSWWDGYIQEFGKLFGYSAEEMEKGWDNYLKTANENYNKWVNETGGKLDEMKRKIELFETGCQAIFTFFKDHAKQKFDEWAKDTFVNIATTVERAINKFHEFKDGAIRKIGELSIGFINKIIETKNSVLGKFDEIKNGIKNRIEEAKESVRKAIDKIKSFFSGDFKLKIKIPKFEIDWKREGKIAEAFQKLGLPGLPELRVEFRANGGFPTEGEMFIAREAGPELVGTMGGRTAVANNDQIVAGIKAGVYEAVAMAMSEYGVGNIQIEAKIEEGILLRKVQNQANQYRMQTGKAPFPTM